MRQAANGVPLFNGTPQEFVDDYKKQYDRDCEPRNKEIKEMLADEPALASLRKEPHKPCLLEQNRITCSVAPVPNSKR